MSVRTSAPTSVSASADGPGPVSADGPGPGHAYGPSSGSAPAYGPGSGPAHGPSSGSASAPGLDPGSSRADGPGRADPSPGSGHPARDEARFRVPRGLIAGTIAAGALVWVPYLVLPGSSLRSALIQSGLYLGLLVLTICSRRVKVLLVRTFQRYTLNPLFRLLLGIGVNPFGLAILETRGRTSGKIRRVPVGNGRQGDSFWIIAEHGSRAGYVHNIAADPHVRVRLRIGWRYRWVDGIATVRPDDDPLARQRRIIAWHPLRALNAVTVRVMGADLLSVHVKLDLDSTSRGEAIRPGPAQPGVRALTPVS